MTKLTNAGAEKALIGALLRGPDEYFQIAGRVSADHFSAVIHREIFTAVRDICEAGGTLSITSLCTKLPEEDENGAPMIGLLMVLLENAREAGSARDYADEIAELAARRKLITLGEALTKAAKSGEKTSDQISAGVILQAQEIMAVASPVKPVKLADASDRVTRFAIKASTTDFQPGFSTGLPSLDDITGRLMGGDFVAILAALGEGKSAVLAQIGKSIARTAPVLACHNEMSEEQNATRALAAVTGLSIRKIREGSFDFSEADRLREAGKSSSAPLQYYLYTNSKMTVRQIRSQALEMKRTIGLGAITIDGSKRLRTDTRIKDPWERKEEITGSIKELAIDLNVPVLVAFQRTRTARRRDEPTPQLDDAEFPSLEHDADIIIGVYRKEAWLMMNKPPAKAGGEQMDKWEAQVRNARGMGAMIGLKVRSGKPFEEKEFKWDGVTTQFKELA